MKRSARQPGRQALDEYIEAQCWYRYTISFFLVEAIASYGAMVNFIVSLVAVTALECSMKLTAVSQVSAKATSLACTVSAPALPLANSLVFLICDGSCAK